MQTPVNMYVKLQGDVATALGRLSRRERRNPRDQAALFIEDGLRRAGVLPLEVPVARPDAFGDSHNIPAVGSLDR